MICLEHITKKYPVRNGWRTVLNDVNFTINKGERIGILGRNGAGKSTLIRVISEVELPTSGRVLRNMSMSWPLAFSGAFQGSLTGMDNLRFICRIYNADVKYVQDFVEDFSELGSYMKEPVKRYSSGMRARLAFGLSMAIEFDCYLIDEVIAVGDAKFERKCQTELFEKRGDRSMILVSHSASLVKELCSKAMVLEKGDAYNFEDVDHAYAFYNDVI